jgi:uncharacterized protein with PIN domain
VKIIRNALTEGPQTKTTKCSGCRSELEVSAEDVTFVSDQRDGDAFKYQCPVCKTVTWLDASGCPKAWRLVRP